MRWGCWVSSPPIAIGTTLHDWLHLPVRRPIVALITSSTTLGYARSTLPETKAFFEILPDCRANQPLIAALPTELQNSHSPHYSGSTYGTTLFLRRSLDQQILNTSLCCAPASPSGSHNTNVRCIELKERRYGWGYLSHLLHTSPPTHLLWLWPVPSVLFLFLDQTR